ncbi:MAG: hypothetical protein HRT88_22165, partial [Lentisphaeraceae bacterium]|nr:hypothetical protein [Lentisphaeraceae bacterium]
VAIIQQGHAFWLIYAIAFSYMCFAAGAPLAQLIKGDDNSDKEAFIAVGVFSLITCLFHGDYIPVIIVLAIVIFAHKFILHAIIKRLEILNEEILRSHCEIIQCAVLILGLIFLRPGGAA